MSKIFISHSSTNNAQALAIRMWLKTSGWDECFLDISVDEGLGAGRWKDALKQAGDRCKVVLCLLSPTWLKSDECQLEYKLGERSGKTIVGIIVESMSLETIPKDFLANWQCFDLANDPDKKEFDVENDRVPKTRVSFGAAGLKRLEIGLRKAGLDPAYFVWPPPNDPLRAPYPGLRTLEEDDVGVFFGRDRQLYQVERTLLSIRERNEPQMFVIQSASGAGKSSFLRAGLWPRLRRNHDRSFFLPPVIRPEGAAITGTTGLITSFEAAFREVGVVQKRASIQNALKKGRDGVGFLIDQVRRGAHKKLCEPDAPLPTVLFSIDQWEQLYEHHEETESDDFLDLIQQVLELCRAETSTAHSCLPSLALAAVRSDTHDRLNKDERFLGIRKEWFELPSLRREDYKIIIEGPANRSTAAGHKLTIDPALTEQLLQDVVGTDALPLLGNTLHQLWHQYGGDEDLTRDEYHEWGGLGASIRAALNQARKDPGSSPVIPLNREERENLLQNTFVPWFVTIDQETGEFKSRETVDSDIPESIRPMVERLIQARLLVRSRRFLEGYQKEVVVIKLATDTVINEWRAPSAWSQSDRDLLIVVDMVRKAAREWESHGRGKDWLVHSGARLRGAQEVQARPTFSEFLGKAATDYLNACTAEVPTKHTSTENSQWMWVKRACGQGLELLGTLGRGVGAVFRFLLGLAAIGWVLNFVVPKDKPEHAQPPTVPTESARTEDDKVPKVIQGGGAIPEPPPEPKPELVQPPPVPSMSSGAGGVERKSNEKAAQSDTAMATITVTNGFCGPIDYYAGGKKVVSDLALGKEVQFRIAQGEYETTMCRTATGDCSDMGRESWLKEEDGVPLGSRSGCWLPRPLVHGVWMQAQEKERAHIVERFKKEAQEKYRALGYEFARLRKLPLNFYTDAELIEAEIVTRDSEKAVVDFVVGSKAGVAVIDGRDLDTIESLNEHFHLDLSDDEKVKTYIQYFLGSVFDGNKIVQEPRDIIWRDDADAEVKATVQSKLGPIKVKQQMDGIWYVKATVHKRRDLVSCDLLIDPFKGGDVRNISEETLATDIPAKKQVFGNSLRYEE